jgi:hypothetical protein
MRPVSAVIVGLVLSSLLLVGCKSSHEEGVKSSYLSQWTTVSADTKTTTDAAKAVLEADSLRDIQASSTNLDGMATGKKADGTKVHVAVKKKEAGSEVSVTIGTLGDPSLGAEYAKRIKDKAEGR